MKTKLFNKKLLVILFALLFCIALPFAAACDEKVNDGNTDEIAGGSLRSLQSAYDCGLLSTTDIKDISYYMWGSVYVYDGYDEKTNIAQTYEIEYTPATELTSLSQSEIKAIKYAFYLENINYLNEYTDFAACEEDFIISFYGNYNGSYVVRVEVADWGYIALVEQYYFDGTYLETGYPLLEVFTFDTELSEEQKTEVEQAWNSQNECALVWYDEEAGINGLICLGVYNGYIILYDDYLWQGYDVACVITEKDIGGYVFEHNYPFALYAYANGVFNDLEEAYQSRNLNDSNIAAIYFAYNSYNL